MKRISSIERVKQGAVSQLKRTFLFSVGAEGLVYVTFDNPDAAQE